jgi:hypothetical protein
MTNWPLIHLCEVRMAFHRRKYNYAHARRIEHQAEVNNNKKHFPNHHDALALAESLVHKWGTIEGEQAREVHRYADKIHQLRPASPVPEGEGTCVPKTAWNPYRRTIANWIARELYDAVAGGAEGYVTSGLRTYTEQAHLYWLSQHGGNIAARPGESNHEGYVYSAAKSGAVDWWNPSSLARALRRKSHTKLLWAEEHGLADTVHFSKTGH